MAVAKTLSDNEEYSLRSIAVLGGTMHSKITVGNVTLPKAVLSTVKIFAVYLFSNFERFLEYLFFFQEMYF